MNEQEARDLAHIISKEDHRVMTTAQPKPSKTRCYSNDRLYYVHVLLKAGQRQALIDTYETWESIKDAWSVL